MPGRAGGRRLFRGGAAAARCAGLAAFLSILPACADDASTEPSSAPAQLLAVSPAVDTVLAGERADPPISVRVANSLGDPVEGIPVRFLLASGPGRVDPVALSNRQGVAEAEFRAGTEPGEARIRVDIPGAGNVGALEFRVRVLPAATVVLSKVGGEGQQAEVASQLPLPFRVRAVTPSGSPAGGVPIAWRLAAGEAAGARLTADTTFTDAEGESRILLTLGRLAGDHAVVAHAARGVGSDTLRFTARATPVPPGSVRLDSVRPLPLRAGEEAVAFGSGFRASEAANEVRVEGEAAEILEATPSTIRLRVPLFGDRCLPARTVGIRVLAAGEPSNGQMAELEPREAAVSLAVGEGRTLAGPEEVSCLQLAAEAGPREFWLAVHSAGRVARSAAPLRLLARAGGDIAGPPAAAALSPGDRLREATAAEGTREGELRRAVRRELERRRPMPARLPGADSDPALAAAVLPVIGDTLTFRFAVRQDLTASCADTANRIAGVVQAVGAHGLVVADAAAPAPGFGAEDWAALAEEFDRVVFPTDTAYFGSPRDIDGNGRVILLFTPEVNRLTPRGSAALVGGFFLPLDLAASGRGGEGVPSPEGETCPASNEGEILYAVVPDPDGAFGDPLTLAQASRIARQVLPHELQHLINAQRRVFREGGGFGALEETWLDEGLSHLAEEVTGLRFLELGTRQNLTFDRVAATREALDAFNAFHIQNFFNLSLFMLGPGMAPTLAAEDPGGLGGLQMRGFAWLLLRWLGDHEGGADERLLFRQLAGGGDAGLRGIANLERSAGERWQDLLADFFVALALDDEEVEPASPRHRVATWNLRDIYAQLNRNPSAVRRFPLPFPLSFASLAFESAAADFELRSSTTQYFRLRSGTQAPPLAVSLLSPGGGRVPESAAPQITIVRTR